MSSNEKNGNGTGHNLGDDDATPVDKRPASARDESGFPAGIIQPSADETAKQLGRLRGLVQRTDEFIGRLEQLVREGGFDRRTREVMIDAADHLDELPCTAMSAARLLRLLAES